MPAVVSRSSRRRPINEINMVPFIDVMLVLLIIFMVTAPMLRPGKIDLPKVGKSSAQKSQVIVLTVKPDGSRLLEDQTQPHSQPQSVDKNSMSSTLQGMLQGRKDVTVLIDASAQLQYKDVMQAYEDLQHAGAPHIALHVLSTTPKK